MTEIGLFLYRIITQETKLVYLHAMYPNSTFINNIQELTWSYTEEHFTNKWSLCCYHTEQVLVSCCRCTYQPCNIIWLNISQHSAFYIIPWYNPAFSLEFGLTTPSVTHLKASTIFMTCLSVTILPSFMGLSHFQTNKQMSCSRDHLPSFCKN